MLKFWTRILLSEAEVLIRILIELIRIHNTGIKTIRSLTIYAFID
jgi:hypothetical protein